MLNLSRAVDSNFGFMRRRADKTCDRDLWTTKHNIFYDIFLGLLCRPSQRVISELHKREDKYASTNNGDIFERSQGGWGANIG